MTPVPPDCAGVEADVLAALPERVIAAVDTVGEAGEDVDRAVTIAHRLGSSLPDPGTATLTRWAVFAAVAARSLTVARVLEAHADALAILHEAGQAAVEGTWGVYAAEAAGHTLSATPAEPGHRYRLDGSKPWCSLAAHLDSALVTARTPAGRQLFRVGLRQPGVEPLPAGTWVARGLRSVVSAPVRFDGALADAVGEPGWYLHRPGFGHGGMGVAACWFGGAVGVLDRLRRHASERGGDLVCAQLGAADVALHAARTTLHDAAARVDADGAAGADGTDGDVLALRVRAVVADAVERVLQHAAHALGPGPLAFEADHAARVADLGVYVRQHHAERDLAALGAALIEKAPRESQRA